MTYRPLTANEITQLGSEIEAYQIWAEVCVFARRALGDQAHHITISTFAEFNDSNYPEHPKVTVTNRQGDLLAEVPGSAYRGVSVELPEEVYDQIYSALEALCEDVLDLTFGEGESDTSSVNYECSVDAPPPLSFPTIFVAPAENAMPNADDPAGLQCLAIDVHDPASTISPQGMQELLTMVRLCRQHRAAQQWAAARDFATTLYGPTAQTMTLSVYTKRNEDGDFCRDINIIVKDGANTALAMDLTHAVWQPFELTEANIAAFRASTTGDLSQTKQLAPRLYEALQRYFAKHFGIETYQQWEIEEPVTYMYDFDNNPAIGLRSIMTWAVE